MGDCHTENSLGGSRCTFATGFIRKWVTFYSFFIVAVFVLPSSFTMHLKKNIRKISDLLLELAKYRRFAVFLIVQQETTLRFLKKTVSNL